MKPKEQPYMGLSEAAEYLAVSKQVVNNWMRRGKFPEPCERLAMGPVWETEVIVKFKEHHDARV